MSTVTLVCTGVGKAYVPGNWVLRDFDLMLNSGEIHGLVGVNGAGKSTIIKILSGVTTPDTGEITIRGATVRRFEHPAQAIENGIGVVHQELPLLPNLSVSDNLVLGIAGGSSLGRVSAAEQRSDYEKWAEYFPAAPELDALLGECGLFQWQIVSIIRALGGQAEVVVLDEPTSSLDSGERVQLHKALKAVVQQGRSVLYVSHFLDDVLDVCSNVTVLRDGNRVLTCDTTGVTETDLLQAMLGSTFEKEAGRHALPIGTSSQKQIAIEVSNLKAPNLGPISFHADIGECVGFYGLQDSGVDRLFKSIYGTLPSNGSVRLGKTILSGPVRDRVRAGLAWVSGNRRSTLMPEWSVAWNHALPSFARKRLLHSTDSQGSLSRTDETISKLRVVGSGIARLGSLSGGNQQKVALGRWLASPATVFLMLDPTLGVDVAGRDRIHSAIHEASQDGRTFLIQSTDPEEIVNLCDRVYVMAGGALRAQLSGGEISVEKLEELTRSGARHVA